MIFKINDGGDYKVSENDKEAAWSASKDQK